MNILPLQTSSFVYEHLFDSPKNLSKIKHFTVANESGLGLVSYLNNVAPSDEEDNSARTYIIKDNETDEIAGYFSLRAGLFTINIEDDYFYSVPAAELSNFAVNDSYRKKHPYRKNLGSTIFYEFVLPLVHYLKDFIGIQAVYIYALPQDRLIDHYGTMGFLRLSEEDEKFVHEHVKPKYDDTCIFMYQML